MPGRLRPTATCPHCGDGLICIVDTMRRASVTREYFHAKPAFGRRRRFCVKTFRNLEVARMERRDLEA